MRTPTIEQQTGWRRPHPQTLLQDMDTLLRVTHFEFDLDDPGFRFYCNQRGVLYLAGRENSECWQATRQAGRSGTIQGEIDKIFHLACARLTDAWDLYHQPAAAEIMKSWVPPGPHDPYAKPAPWQPSARLSDWTPPDVRDRIKAAEKTSETSKPGQIDLFADLAA
jgi:hypothetical protein